MTLGKEVRIFRSVDAIGQDSINSIATGAFFTYEWFKTIETQESFDASPIYFAVYDNGKLIAVVPSFAEIMNWKDLFYQHFQNPKLARYVLPYLDKMLILHRQLGLSQDRMLVCYSPFSCRSEVLIGETSQKKHVLSLLLEKINEFCKKERYIFSAFLFVSQFDKLLTENLPTFGYNKFPGLNTSYLNVRWTSFEDYLKSFNCKTRKNIKRELRKCAENGVTVEEPESRDLPAYINELSLNLYRKYNVPVTSYSSLFGKLNEYAKSNFKAFIAKKNNEIVGFSLYLRQGSVLDACFAGFKYDCLTNTDFAYYNVCYYAPIQWAIKEGIKIIHYTDGGEKMKVHRGCEPEKTYSFVKCHDVFLEPLINNPRLIQFFSYPNQRLNMQE